LIGSSHDRTTISRNILLPYPAPALGVSAIMLNPVSELLATMNIPEQHIFGFINHIPVHYRDKNKS
tara:strand:+ start:455 stop:652 length:198 start_codon:yes stop_codon:yes gene_type:complete